MDLKINELRVAAKQYFRKSPRLRERLLVLIELAKRTKSRRIRDLDYERVAAEFGKSARTLYRWKRSVVYLLALNTGMRAGEIWGLKPQDFCFSEEEGATLFLRRQFNRITREFAPRKGELVTGEDKSRHVPCSKELRVELEQLTQQNNIRSDRTVFQSSNGKIIDHDSFADRFDRDVKAWGGKKIRFHDLRHTAATLMLSNGIDVKTVKEIMGHSIKRLFS